MSQATPPRWAQRFLRWFCDELLFEEIAGDLEEAYHYRLQNLSKEAADRRYIADVFTFCQPYAFEKYSRAKQFLPMLDNYFKIALRNIFQRKGFTAINALGLIAGIGAVLLIGLYLRHELTYDQHVPNYENTYRLINKYRDQTYSCMRFPNYNSAEREGQLALINHLNSYDDVAKTCHFVPTDSDIGGSNQFFVEIDDRQFITDNILITNTGEAFQDMFPQTFLLGDPKTAFAKFSTIVLAESTAERWWGSDWELRRVIGKEVQIGEELFTLAGVVEDVPDNSHYSFEVILHQPTIPSWAAYTYVQTDKKTSIDDIVARLNKDADLFYPGYSEDELERGIAAIALTDVHFTPDTLYELKPIANTAYLSTFGWVALILLLIIWTNYTNLSVAIYADRQREIGMRKVLGARGRDISFQLLLEAVALSLLCLPIILGIVAFLLPSFSTLMGVDIGYRQLFAPATLLTLTGLLVFTGLVSGGYPALVYGGRATIKLFGQAKERMLKFRYLNFRNGLITLQFFLVVGLLSMTYFIYQQMQFVASTDLGYTSEGVLYFNLDGAEKGRQLKTRLDAIPAVRSVGIGGVPGAEMFNQGTYKMQNTETVLSDGTEQYLSYGTLQTLDMDCAACHLLDNGKERIFVINRTAAEKLAKIKAVAPEELIGEVLITEPEWENEQYGFGVPRTIDGIIDDYNFFSLKYPHQSLLLSIYREVPYAYEMLVRIDMDDVPAALREIETAYEAVETERPFKVSFLEDRLARLYENEARSGKLLALLGGLAVLLALMGLAGVVAYQAYRRQKEIGIRKVLGASVGNILFQFHREFSLLLLVATIAAIPLSLYLAERWLAGFAFRIEPGTWVILGAGLLTLILVLLVITVQARRAAVRPPMEVLRAD